MKSSHEIDTERTISRAVAAGRAAWGDDWRPRRVAVAPGRIEILGSHTDYNGGPVLAAAVDRATVVLSDDWESFEVLFADFDYGEPMCIDLNAIDQLRSDFGRPAPHDFVLGVAERSRSIGRMLRTGRMVVATSVPIGSGMSSSAALCVALSLVMNREPSSGAALVYDAQAAENWTGVPCGTMDQSASVFGNVIRFEGPEGTISVAPELGDYCFVVVDSRVQRSLGTSAYPVRVAECREAVALLEAAWDRPLGNLAALSMEDLRLLESSPEPVLDRVLLARVRHIVSDIDRVNAGAAAMDARDWETFGDIMNASGASSAVDYAISHPRVEELVAAMRAVPGVAGARMMGGGEGGSTLALLRVEALDALREALVAFFDDDSMRTTVIPLSFAPGARSLSHDQIAALIQ